MLSPEGCQSILAEDCLQDYTSDVPLEGFRHSMRPFLSGWYSISYDNGGQYVHTQIFYTMKWAPGWMLCCMRFYTCGSGICKPLDRRLCGKK